MQVSVKKLQADATIPQYQSRGAACFDLHAAGWITRDLKSVSEGQPVVIGTGLAFEIPEGYVMLVFSRSGTGFKHDVRLANCVGVIDSDYRGEVKVKLTRDASDADSFSVAPGDRIAQAMIVPVPYVDFLEVSAVSETERGEAGLGSTGV